MNVIPRLVCMEFVWIKKMVFVVSANLATLEIYAASNIMNANRILVLMEVNVLIILEVISAIVREDILAPDVI